MQLKKLEIQGFKSFADKVVLYFNEGMTAIVGPNGCGKSNISDAIRWVLGEQSAKSMRGGKMPDVIFNGTSHRKPLNIAEVTLTFSDVQGALPVEFEEVAIKRRLHRSGESDYFINGHQVRLKDIQSMLWGSGVGHQAFCIFEQGKIDQVIQYSPTERVSIFVEAAGIVRFLHRKRETIKKLQETDQNLSRINDVHQEVEKRVKLLTEQAERALYFKDVKGQLVELDKMVLSGKIDALRQKLEQLIKSQDKLSEEVKERCADLKLGEEELKALRDQLGTLEKTLLSKNEEVFKARGEKQLKDQERKNYQERGKEAAEKEKLLKKELQELLEQRNKRDAEAKVLKKELEMLTDQKKILETQLQETQKDYQALEKDAGLLREQQLKTQHDRLKLTQLESQVESELKQKGVRQEHLLEKHNQLFEKKQRLQETALAQEKVVHEKRLAMKQVEASIDSQRSLLQHLEHQLNEHIKEIEELQKKWDILQKELTEQRARRLVLTKLKEEMQGFSSGAKQLALESLSEKSSLFGKLKPLYECLIPQKGAEEAISAVMRPYMQTLVVLNEKDLNEVVAFAQSKKLSDYSLLCLSHLEKALSQEEVKGRTTLKERVAHHPLANHFLSKIYITEHLKEALETVHAYVGVEAWASGGIYVDRNKVVFYPGKTEQNVFMREAELKTLERDLKKLEGDARRLEEGLLEIKKKRAELQTERQELDKAVRKEEMKLVESNFALQKANGDVERTKGEIPLIDKEMDNVKQSVQTQADQIETLLKKHVTAKVQLSEVQQQAQGAEEHLEKHLKDLKDARVKVQAGESTLKKVADDHYHRSYALNGIEIKEQESQKREARLKGDLQQALDIQSALQNRTSSDKNEMERIEASLNSTSQECKQYELEIKALKGKWAEKEEKLKGVQGDIKDKESKEHHIGVQIAQVETTKQGLIQELLERHQITPENVKKEEFIVQISLDQAEKRLKQMRNEVENASDVNFAAIEELEKHKERSRFFEQEVLDMNNAKHELLAIIAELDGQSRSMFHKTFTEIRGHFQNNFRVLFEGGDADLELIDAEDILETGIEIIAKPPGKQMRSIQLLSGGEKCLTAMALLFAIFEVKPSPFCILDEIDAPLDDSNVERFARIVQKYADRCQFIVITHNKRTMAIADTLFGVSMEEKGVSKILSMAFAKQTAPVVSVV